MSSPLLTMNDGRTIPQVGLGVYKIADDEAAAAVSHALDVGYRHIDTAALYRNERGVGRGIRESGVPREDVFVTTKVWNDDHGFDATLRAFDTSLGLLGLDHVDLYLIHWPVPSKDLYVDTWRALERLHEEGRARSIGVSNFTESHLSRLIGESGTKPVLNQVELHPWLQQSDLREFGREMDILTEAWSPLARGRVLDSAALAPIAAKHGRTAAQIVIRWHVQLGNVVIPKSVTPARIEENFDVFDFALDADDLRAISAFDSGDRTGRHPDED
ncbi:MAG: aldo/keto reductase [Naasia sp.]